MVRRFIKTFLFFLLLGSNAWATDYWVTTTGSDANPCTLAQPCLTGQAAAALTFAPDDNLIFGDGTYTARTNFTGLHGSVEATKNITNITQANPCVVTVAGHGYSNGDWVEILGLTSYKINGMQKLFNRWFQVANATTDTFELSGVDSRAFDAYITGGTVARVHPITIKAEHRGLAIFDTSLTVTGWSSVGVNLYVSSPVALPATVGASINAILWKVGLTHGGNAKTSAGAVVSEGDYYFDLTTSTYRIFTTSNPTSAQYKGWNKTKPVLSLSSSTYVKFDGLYPQYSSEGFQISTSASGTVTNHIQMVYCSVHYNSFHGAFYIIGTSPNQLSYINIEHADVAYTFDTGALTNGHGIKIGGNSDDADVEYITVYDSTIHDIWYHAIQFSNGATHGYFAGNTEYNYSTASTGAGAGVRCGIHETNHANKDCVVYDNDIGGGAGGVGSGQGTGIYVQDDEAGSRIFRNRIHDNKWYGIFYFYTAGTFFPYDSVVFNNLIYNNGTAGVRSKQSYQSIYIYKNSFYNNGEASLNGTGATMSALSSVSNGVSFFDNIVYNFNAAMISSATTSSIASDYNVLYRTNGFRVIYNGVTYSSLTAYTTATGVAHYDANSKTTDPLYANGVSGDLRVPSPTTPAFANGTSFNSATGDNIATQVITDYDLATSHSPLDIGAYNAQGNLLIFPSVTLSSVFPANISTVTISFQTTGIDVQKNWKVVFTLPSGFILDQGGTTAITTSSGLDGTLSLSSAGQVITITRNNDGSITAPPATLSFTINHVRNPSTSGVTGTYAISLQDSGSVEQAASNAVPGSIISDVSPGTLSGLTISGAKI